MLLQSIQNSRKPASIMPAHNLSSVSTTLPLQHQKRELFQSSCRSLALSVHSLYLSILTTAPEPTVRPPSRIAKRVPSSIAIGAINSISIVILSPGIIISTPSGN